MGTERQPAGRDVASASSIIQARTFVSGPAADYAALVCIMQFRLSAGLSAPSSADQLKVSAAAAAPPRPTKRDYPQFPKNGFPDREN